MYMLCEAYPDTGDGVLGLVVVVRDQLHSSLSSENVPARL